MISNVDRVLYCRKDNVKTEVDPDHLIRAVEAKLVTSIDVGIKSGSIFELKRIYEAYIKTVQERGGNEHMSEKSLKKCIKKLLQDEINVIAFEKSVQRNTSEKIYSRFATDEILDAVIAKTLENKPENLKVLPKAAKIIRASCLQHIKSSDGKYTVSSEYVPTKLFSMIRWIIAGFHD